MDLTPEQLGTGVVGLIIIAGAIGQYIQMRRDKKAEVNPIIAGVGLELGNRHQMDALISEVAGIRRAAEVIADRRTSELKDMYETLLERLDHAEERKAPW